MINSRTVTWTQSYEKKGPHFILIINMIFLGIQLLRFQYIRPCNKDEIRTNAYMVVYKSMTLELQLNSTFQGIPKLMVYIHKREDAPNYINKIGKCIHMCRTSSKLI
jgi:hypothetical protein